MLDFCHWRYCLGTSLPSTPGPRAAGLQIPKGSSDRKSGVCRSLIGSWSGRWKPRSALERGQRVEALRRRQELLGKRGIVSLCAGCLLRELLCWERAGAELSQGMGRRRSLVLVPLSPGRQRAPSSELECARECQRMQLPLVFVGLKLC